MAFIFKTDHLSLFKMRKERLLCVQKMAEAGFQPARPADPLYHTACWLVVRVHGDCVKIVGLEET